MWTLVIQFVRDKLKGDFLDLGKVGNLGDFSYTVDLIQSPPLDFETLHLPS